MKFFFSTVGRHNPMLKTELPEHMAYPVSQRGSRGLDLDYTALLLGEGFIIDGDVFQQLVEDDQDYLRPMVNSLTKLSEAGLLEPMPMGEIVEGNHDSLVEKTDLLVQHPEEWLPLLRRQWNIVQPQFEQFQADFGAETKQNLNLCHVGVESWLLTIDRAEDDELRQKLMAVMDGIPGAEDQISQYDLRGILRFVVSEILATDLIGHELEQPFIDWYDNEPLFDQLYLTRWGDEPDEFEVRRQARLLFDVVIPELRPDNVEKVIRFVQDDKAVTSLRKELIDRLATGEDISREWFVRYLNAAVKNDLVTDGRLRKLRYLGSASGLVLPGAGLAGQVAMEVGKSALEAAGESALEAATPPPRWYYALQRIAMQDP